MLFIAGDVGRGKIFLRISGSSKNAHSRLPVYVRRRVATFDTRVPHNAGNVFEVMTFSGTVEMTRVGICYIRGVDYPGEYSATRHNWPSGGPKVKLGIHNCVEIQRQ